jgi:phenylpropionate dioxygenase-like ring-hydroxylating dioxygenase large terminal subunit
MTATSSDSLALIADLLESAKTPLGRARTLAPALYHDVNIHQLELERIFKTDWLCVGTAGEIPAAGDYLSFSIADQPIYVMRGKDGWVRSFSNVCLHRMMRLLDGRGQCRLIVCPYHGWSYDERGRLIGAGHMDHSEQFDKADFKLPEIRTEIWEGWIYVTLNADAASIASGLADLLPVVAPYGMADYVPVVTQDHVWQTNWKFLCENFMEGYHLPVAHRATVGAWFPAKETKFPDHVFDAFTYQTFIKDETATYGRAHRANTRLVNEWRYTSVMPTVFPTHMYVLAPDHLWYLSLRPKGVNEVHVRFGASLAPEVVAALGESREAFVRELVRFFDTVNAEDRFLVEGLQQGSAAPLATAGPLSWLERELHDFRRYLTRRLSDSVAR